MAGNKTILNSTALECARELLRRNFAVPYSFQNLGATLSVRSVSATHSEIELTPNPQLLDAARPITQPFKLAMVKYDFGSRVPRDLSYEGLYPCTIAQFNQYMSGGFDFIAEPGDFEFLLDGEWVVFDQTRSMDVVPDASHQVRLRTSAQSRRFIAGAEFTMYVIAADVGSWTPMVVSGSAPDAALGEPYTFAYTISGGVPPYRTVLVNGQLPAPLDNAGQFSGHTSQPGSYQWVLEVYDSVGAMRQITDSMRVETQSMALVSAPGPAVLGVPFDQSFVIQGGLAPYRFQLVSGEILTGLELSAAGRLSGTANALAASATMIVSDSSGQELELTFHHETVERSEQEIALSLLSKLEEWFEFDSDHTYVNGDVIYGRVNSNVARVVAEFPLISEVAENRPYAMVNLAECYLDVDPIEFGTDQGVFFYYRRNDPIATQETLMSQRDAIRGWDLAFTADRNLRSRLVINGQTYATTSSDPVQAFGPALLGLQRSSNRLSHWLGAERLPLETAHDPVVVRTDLPMDPLSNAAVSLRIGRGHPLVGIEAPRMHLGSVILVNQPLLVDELVYLENDGQGRAFDEVVVASGP